MLSVSVAIIVILLSIYSQSSFRIDKYIHISSVSSSIFFFFSMVYGISYFNNKSSYKERQRTLIFISILWSIGMALLIAIGLCSVSRYLNILFQ